MIKQIFLLLLFATGLRVVNGQELYVFTEPASNMASGSLGFRLNNYLMPLAKELGNKKAFRIEPEIMWGVNKHLMLHLAAYGSDMFQPAFRAEGASFYAKYRFLSNDDIHSHFRVAGFAKLSLINNPTTQTVTTQHIYYDSTGNPSLHNLNSKASSNQLNIDGDHSGYQLGVVATKLEHKLAVSGSLAYIHRLNNMGSGQKFGPGDSRSAISITASAGYLLFPKAYTNYKQANINLYVEMLGLRSLDGRGYSLDAAPAVQCILNSLARIDLGYRFRVAGDISRHYNSSFLLRLEYNWLNAIQKK